MRYYSLDNILMLNKAIRIFEKKKGIGLTEHLLNIGYCCILLHRSQALITARAIRDKLSKVNRSGIKDETLYKCINYYEQNGYLTSIISKRRGFICRIYSVNPALVLLLNDFEKTLRRARHDY
jgi:hypothetical protein